MKQFWDNPFIQSAANYSVVILCMVVFLAVFEIVTKYRNWEEMKKGNMAVSDGNRGKDIWNRKHFPFCNYRA